VLLNFADDLKLTEVKDTTPENVAELKSSPPKNFAE
jgi:hypothetical protein